MDIEEHIREIRSDIEAHRFANEAAVTLGVVLRLLSVLNWPCWNTHVVAPQYAIQGRRADFALCHPIDQPIALIEVKQPGMSGTASEQQLFEYAFHAGVPLVVLTDGQQWDFFLPAEQGDYGERRVYKLDLLEHQIDECLNRLVRYLKYEAVVSGAAIKAAREDHHKVTQTRLVQATLPKAWRKLVEEKGDLRDLLIELITDQADTLCGNKPDPETVAHFLRESLTLTEQPASDRTHSVKPSRSAASQVSPPRPEPEPRYRKTYRDMLNRPNNQPSRMLEYIRKNSPLSFADLKKYLEQLGYKVEKSGSTAASLNALKCKGYVKIDGRGDSKTITWIRSSK